MIGSEEGLALTAISKRFASVMALEEAWLTASPGEAMGLIGANGAGKSTLMNVLGGIVQRDSGSARLGGKDLDLSSPRASKGEGIAFVHQELMMLPMMSVAENILIDHLPGRYGTVDYVALERRAAELLARLGCHLDVTRPVGDLSAGDQQMIEVARALSRDCRVVIFDEATSSLTGPEKQRLFEVIRGLKAEGMIVVYITHFLDEVFTVCDRVTVMRNGTTVATGSIEDHTPASLAHLMLGEGVAQDRIESRRPTGDIVLKVRGLSRGAALDGIDLDLRGGEIVGVWGLLGSGRTELMRALVGLDPIDRGELEFDGNPIEPSGLAAVTAFVTEDRRGEGIFPGHSVETNLSLPSLGRLRNRLGFIDRNRERTLAGDIIRRLGIKLSGPEQNIATLSGGNQQKVVFGRWLATEPRIFLLDEPTRGLDIGAKTEMLRLAVEVAEAGGAVLLVASEPEELMRVCHRFVVMARGRIVGELPGDTSRDELVARISTLPAPALPSAVNA